ncbi:FAD dependent oxidoreductase [Cladochytrium replicatum]|nr:FAD dependent oxidoreductase [Cladochytrium replicatum]
MFRFASTKSAALSLRRTLKNSAILRPSYALSAGSRFFSSAQIDGWSVAANTLSADVVVLGGGLAGISTAYYMSKLSAELAKAFGVSPPTVMLVERGNPMALTSTNSTGGVRNFYPQFWSMTSLANRSIDLLRELSATSGNHFEFNQTGYLFLSAKREMLSHYLSLAHDARQNGSGPVRFNGVDVSHSIVPTHASEQGRFSSFDPATYALHDSGIDISDDVNVIRRLLPGVTKDACVMMHVRKAGYLNVEKLGAYLWEGAKRRGVQLVRADLVGVEHEERVEDRTEKLNRKVSSVLVRDPETHHFVQIKTKALVLSPGPHLKSIGEMLGIKIPVQNELHARVRVEDPLGIIRSDAPFSIWSDDITLPWTVEQHHVLQALAQKDPAYAPLLRRLAVPGIAGCHARPLQPAESNGKRAFYGIWTYDNDDVYDTPIFPPKLPKLYGSIVLRALSVMLPGLSQYFTGVDSSQDPAIRFNTDLTTAGGYYCKTDTNTPLLGPITTVTRHATTTGSHDLDIEGLFACAGVSGFGVMCSQSAGEIVALHVLRYLEGLKGGDAGYGSKIKYVERYAESFMPDRYLADPAVVLAPKDESLKAANQL